MSINAPAAIEGDFQPMLQVDRFAWPSVVRRLAEQSPEAIEQLAAGLLQAAREGRKVLGISGCRRGEGATTMLLSAARRLAQQGVRVVVIDADQTDAQVGQRLGLLPEAGWQEVVTGRASLADVVVESIEDCLDVLPARETFAGTGVLAEDQCRLEQVLQTCREGYELVLVDVGPLECSGFVTATLGPGIGHLLDGVVLVHDNRATSKKRLQELGFSLRTAGVVQIGVIENFARAA